MKAEESSKLCPLFSENVRYIKFKNADEIAITTNVYLNKHYQYTKNFMSPCLTVPYIYCLRLSETSSFRRKKLNMCNKLVTLRLVQIK